ncbi:hypothetical protein, partial [Jatrophihabitans sp.]|uniref:hypothetical protein n=1 Tax=Jatrophihabitans sp. TaxID=1932789 RepID=UPI0030C72262|nr:hypothetical protein [Jatrophihabitans sp.]
HLVLALFAFEVSGPKAVKELAAEEPNAPGVATLRTHRFTVSVTAHDAGIAIAATGRSANAAAESARAVTNALIELVSYSSEGPDFVTTEAAHLVRDVSVPNAPYGTLRLRNLTAGAMAGLLLGLGLALVRKRRVQETDPNLVSH